MQPAKGRQAAKSATNNLKAAKPLTKGGHPVAFPDGQTRHLKPVDREAVGEDVRRPDVETCERPA